MGPAEAIIVNRRSLRALEPLGSTTADAETLANELAKAAMLAPSADNRQPWRFVSVYKDPQLGAIRKALSPLNKWAEVCSLFVVVCASPTESVTGPSDSGKNGPINYSLYDTGLASAFLMLRATDFGLIAHPIAGFDERAVARAIALDRAPVAAQIVALIAIGRKSTDPSAVERIPEKLRNFEVAKNRPPRKALKDIAFHQSFGGDTEGSAAGTETGAIEGSDQKPTFDRDVILVNDDGKIYHLDQATLLAMTSVDELTAEEQVPYGFIKELTDLGISVAAIPTLPQMNAAIFCYLLNLGSLKPPTTAVPAAQPRVQGTETSVRAADANVKAPPQRAPARKRRNMQYTGM